MRAEVKGTNAKNRNGKTARPSQARTRAVCAFGLVGANPMRDGLFLPAAPGKEWRGRGAGESVAKAAIRAGGSEASRRGGDGEGGGGKGRAGLCMGGCMH